MAQVGEAFSFRIDQLQPGDVVTLRGQHGTRLVSAQHEAVEQLADLTSRLMDLERAVEFCRMLEDQAQTTTPLIRTALATSAILSYGRAFSRDARSAITVPLKPLEDLGGDAVEIHHRMLYLRNKFVAHSENPFESIVVGLTLAEAPRDREVLGVYVNRLDAADFQGGPDIIRLSTALLDWAHKKNRLLARAVHARARRVPLDELYRRDPLTFTMPGPADTATKRNR